MNAILTENEAIAERAMQTPLQKDISRAEAKMKRLPQVDCPLRHEFTPGLYIRTVLMPKGSFVVSKIHKTTHPFVVTKGKAAVWIEGFGVKQIAAGHRGITTPGTRRLIYIHEDCEWTTFHPTEKTDVAEIEKDCIYTQSNDILEVDSETVKQLTENNGNG